MAADATYGIEKIKIDCGVLWSLSTKSEIIPHLGNNKDEPIPLH